MVEHTVGIIGMGHKLPAAIRGNDDPIFDWLKKNDPAGQNLFTGYDRRHALAEGETALDILVPAARMAIDDAEVTAAQIDHVFGCVSPNQFIVPADLFDLTGKLGLPETALTIPLANDFSNFNVGVVLADTLVRAGRARNVLVACGGGWTRSVDYRTPQAASVGDGAAAVVIGRGSPRAAARWIVVDTEVIAREQNFGEMGLFADKRPLQPPPSGVGNTADPDPEAEAWTGPYFHIDAAGLKNFKIFGAETAPIAAQRVLQRQNVPLTDVTVTGHQVSNALFDIWKQKLSPAPLFETLGRLGNMTVANIAVNLCLMDELVRTQYILALSLAPDMHAHALLLRRGR